jgi:hypothetical protein
MAQYGLSIPPHHHEASNLIQSYFKPFLGGLGNPIRAPPQFKPA